MAFSNFVVWPLNCYMCERIADAVSFGGGAQRLSDYLSFSAI